MEFIEVNNASYRLRDDGKVDVYSPSGYQILAFDKLPESIQQELKPVVYLYGLTQSCLDPRGKYPVHSVDEIDTDIHWIDQAKFEQDKTAYWKELLISHTWSKKS